MNFWDILVLVVIVAVLSLAGLYVYRAKKKGKKCIGCPTGNCPGDCCNCPQSEN